MKVIEQGSACLDRSTVADHPGCQCAWKEDGFRCREPARPPRGRRGPMPRWCDEHTKARKAAQDNGGSKPREPYRECCQAHQAAGNPGQCPQCEQSRDEIREWEQAHSVSEREASWLAAQLGAAQVNSGGWHIEGPALPRGWKSARGCWEGRTRPEVYHADPFDDDQSRQWLTDNREQFTGDPKSNPV